MTSADFLQFVVTTEFFSACKTSSGKNNHLHLIYLPYLHIEVRAVLGFVLCWKLVRFNMPYIRFLFVRPRLCLRLLSDSVSRRTPLSLANSSYCQVCSGLPPPSDLLMPSTQQIPVPRETRDGYFLFCRVADILALSFPEVLLFTQIIDRRITMSRTGAFQLRSCLENEIVWNSFDLRMQRDYFAIFLEKPAMA